jgi:cysteinyl-tRNA synthetase
VTHDLHPHPPLRLRDTPLPLIDTARIYVCGVTPYDVTHLGHAATFVWVDAATRVLRHIGIQTEVVRNVTDVDDVLTDAARLANTPFDAYAAMHQYQFDHDMSVLSVRRPDHEPRAHRYVPQVVALSQALLDQGAAYERSGSVYFRGAAVPGAHGIDDDDALAMCAEFGEQPGDPDKAHPLDVPVWRASGEGQPSWPSPWGPGRPGWHAECTAMALSVLGASVDLHAGGADLRFPHHAFESAQAEAATGVTPFARAWMHVGTVQVDGAKMAKSTGNLVLVDDLVRDHRPAAVRLLLLDRPWHQPWDYRPDLLDAAEVRLDALYSAAGRRADDERAEQAIIDLLLADLDVSAALDAALESGGRAARTLAAVLALS